MKVKRQQHGSSSVATHWARLPLAGLIAWLVLGSASSLAKTPVFTPLQGGFDKPAATPCAPQIVYRTKTEVRTEIKYLYAPAYSFAVTTSPPIPGATVRYSGPGSFKGEVKTGPDGTFVLQPPRPEGGTPQRGEYTFSVTADEYQPVPISIKAEWGKDRPFYTVPAKMVPAFQSINIVFGNTRLSAINNAKVLLNGKPYPADKTRRDTKDDFLIELQHVPVGAYSLEINHPSFVAYKDDKLEVKGDEAKLISPAFVDTRTTLRITTEPGAEIYLDGNPQQLVAVDKQYTLVVPYDEKTDHVITVKKFAFGDKSSEKFAFLAGKEMSFPLPLTPIVSFEDFTENWSQGLKNWNQTPGSVGWTTSPPVLRIDRPGLILTSKKYIDFTADFIIQFNTGKGAAWAVRGQSKDDYYLFELDRPSGSSAFMTLYSYRVQNGTPKQLRKQTIFKVDPPDSEKPISIGPKEQIHVTIEVVGNEIKHHISVPRVEPGTMNPIVDTLVLDDNPLAYGSFGFSAANGESFMVYPVNITVVKRKP